MEKTKDKKEEKLDCYWLFVACDDEAKILKEAKINFCEIKKSSYTKEEIDKIESKAIEKK